MMAVGELNRQRLQLAFRGGYGTGTTENDRSTRWTCGFVSGARTQLSNSLRKIDRAFSLTRLVHAGGGFARGCGHMDLV
jgi:hypothetical protein